MKKLVIILLLLSGCAEYKDHPKNSVNGIDKFQDGNNTCYTYFQNAISCVKN